MSETADVLRAIASTRAQGKKMALATIVAVTGSTYRRPGARLLVSEDGHMTGNLSGGCLEGEVEQVARQVIDDGEARVVFYDLTADDEVVWGWGLGCNGAIEVLVEPAGKAAEVAGALELAIREERPIAVATVLDSDGPGIDRGARMLVHPDGRRQGSLGDTTVSDAAAGACLEALGSGQTEVRQLDAGGATVRVFVEAIAPPLKLLVCGAGHDAVPLVAHATALGWRVVVVDDRTAMLDDKRFPGARFVTTDPATAAHAASADERTYAIVMSHNYLRDRDYLKSFLRSPVAYIGMLGPRARLERLLDDLSSEGLAVSKDDLERIHGPAGVDVGGEGPEEIAAAIVAEVLAVSRGRDAGFLRDRSGPIHERPGTEQPVG